MIMSARRSVPIVRGLLLLVGSYYFVSCGSSAVTEWTARHVAAWLGPKLNGCAALTLPRDAPIAVAPSPTDPSSGASAGHEQASATHSARSTRLARKALVVRVPAAAVQAALATNARPTATWAVQNGLAPAGVRVTSVGSLAGFLRVGDVLFEAEGIPLHDFGDLLAIVGSAYQARKPRMAGRLWRADEVWTIVVEPGW